MHKDYLGDEIQKDDIVIYPGRRGSSLYLNYGKVEAVSQNGIKVRKSGTGHLATVRETKRMIVVPYSKMTPQMMNMVKGVDVEV